MSLVHHSGTPLRHTVARIALGPLAVGAVAGGIMIYAAFNNAADQDVPAETLLNIGIGVLATSSVLVGASLPYALKFNP